MLAVLASAQQRASPNDKCPPSLCHYFLKRARRTHEGSAAYNTHQLVAMAPTALPTYTPATSSGWLFPPISPSSVD